LTFNFGTGGSSGGGSSGFNFGTSSSSTTKKKGGGGLLGAILHDASVVSGVDLAKHFGGDLANAVTEIIPGLYGMGRAAVAPGHNPSWSELGQQWERMFTDPIGELKRGFKEDRLGQIEAGMAKYYENYYGHNVLSHIYQHPLQPLLDLGLVYTGGAGVAAKAGRAARAAGKEGKLATLGEIADQQETVSRSPRAVFKESGGPVARATTSPRAGVRFRQVAGERLRRTRTGDNSKIAAVLPAGLGPFGSETLKWARAVFNEADMKKISRLDPLRAYNKLIGKLSEDEITALQMRSHGVTAADLKEAWAGTPDGELITPKVAELIDHPNEKMIQAEPTHRAMSQYLEQLYTENGLLRPETAAARNDFSAQQIGEMLGRPAARLVNEDGSAFQPYYMPHLIHDEIGSAPGARVGGGAGMPRRLGTMKVNKGTLISQGNVHYITDVLGPELARRAKYLMHRELFKAHMRGGVPVPVGFKLPKGWSYVRKVTLVRESDRLQTQIDRLQRLQEKGRPSAIRGAAIMRLQREKEAVLRGENKVVGERRQTIPPQIRANAPEGADLYDILKNPDDLRDSTLQQESGFRTTDQRDAVQVGDNFIAIPNRVSKAMTGEYTRSNGFIHFMQRYPIRVWRALILGTRPAFLVNNMIGNGLMYSARTAGNGALRDFFSAMRQMHGDKVARKMLDDPVVSPELRAEILQDHPTLYHGTNQRFSTFDPAKMDENALYGPGVYMTSSPEVASGYATSAIGTHEHFGEGVEGKAAADARVAELRAQGIKADTFVHTWGNPPDRIPTWMVTHYANQAPHVKMLRARVGKPFDVRKEFSATEGARILGLAWRRRLRGGIHDYRGRRQRQAWKNVQKSHMKELGANPTGERIYEQLVRMTGGKAEANKILEEAGYDAIKHEGGLITGGQSHDVTIAFDPKNVEPYFRPPVPPPVSKALTYKGFFEKHFPEQQQGGSFGYTQTPIGQSLWKNTGRRATRLARFLTTAIPHATANLAEVRMRNAMATNLLRNSPEFKAFMETVPKDTGFFDAADKFLSNGKAGKQAQSYISDQIDRSLGQYRHMSPIEAGTFRSLMPFYAWYKAIVSATFHLAIDNPVRAYALYTLGQIGEQTSKQLMGQTLLPQYLQGAVPLPGNLGTGPGGTQRLIATGSLNPWYTVAQLLRSGGDVGQMGINPFLQGAFDEYAKQKNAGGGGYGKVSLPLVAAHGLENIVTGLPTWQLFNPKEPSKVYPNRGAGGQIARREAAFWAWLGIPLKEISPSEATAAATGKKTSSKKSTTTTSGGFNFGTSG